VFGAGCSAEGKVVGIIMPKANNKGTQKHLEIIEALVAI